MGEEIKQQMVGESRSAPYNHSGSLKSVCGCMSEFTAYDQGCLKNIEMFKVLHSILRSTLFFSTNGTSY